MKELQQFKQMLRTGEYVVLDTETTGLNRGEIVQLAVVGSSGQVLMDTLVKPVVSIPPDATRIHGITDDMVADAPGFADILPQLQPLLTGTNVVVYNATYDRKMLHQSAEVAGLEKVDWKALSRWWCAMEAFAEIYHDWNSYRHNYRWQKLSTACAYYKIELQNAHGALADSQATLNICKEMMR